MKPAKVEFIRNKTYSTLVELYILAEAAQFKLVGLFDYDEPKSIYEVFEYMSKEIEQVYKRHANSKTLHFPKVRFGNDQFKPLT